MGKAKAAAQRKRRAKDAKAVGDLLAGGFGGADVAEYTRQLVLAEASRLKQKNATLTPEQRSMILVRMGGLAEKLARLTGEGAIIDERRFLRSANGKRFKQVVLDALRPYPEAARALGEAIKAAAIG